ncbi:MAG: NADH-quinone oxidoreductase subunit L [Dehalococcoidia bacterium]|jgi:NADH-quinone oxidoreductase subunit L|nr:NADH-quinone oxidoreductase subunit L [Dehalococcoidia bacterium]
MILPDIPEFFTWIIYFSPLISFVVIAFILLLSINTSEKFSSHITILAIGISWLLGLWALDTSISHSGHALEFGRYEWMSLFSLNIVFGIQLDSLSALMVFVVTSISLVVQIYSVGYMHGDKGYARYFMFMSLFTTAMLGLVMASSLLQLFVHWELVGLTSYLLVGFWFERPAAAAAAKKAFIVTRFGDFFFMIGLIIVWVETSIFDIASINHLAEAGSLSGSVLAVVALGLFAGAVGKSAQFPLHFWLPDAMEGPTPVSSLLHSATMVAAGVYLLSRFFPVIHASPSEIQTSIAYIGGFTAIFAASMGMVANDIKRVLAYSTISQLGYMVMAIGLGGFVAAVFHLFTHAFFKSLLFQGSGSVNHATGTFDMRKMGGLKAYMPITFFTFLIGALSLSGIFPLAGFWSKDELLLDAWNHDKFLWLIGTIVAFMTAFYMFRVVFLTFFGTYRGGETNDFSHPHESPKSMTTPLIILAVPSVLFGLFALNGFGAFVEATLPHELQHFSFHINPVVLASSTVAAFSGIGLATLIYFVGRPSADDFVARSGPLYNITLHKYYIDEFVERGLVTKVFHNGIGRMSQFFDTFIVDGIVNRSASITYQVGQGTRRLQSGQLQSYASMSIVGVAISIIAIIALNILILER